MHGGHRTEVAHPEGRARALTAVPKRRWVGVTVSIAIVLIMFGAVLGAAGLIAVSPSEPTLRSPLFPTASKGVRNVPSALINDLASFLLYGCSGAFGHYTYGAIGPACNSNSLVGAGAGNPTTRNDAINNTLVTLFNTLNLSASQTSLFNATTQELLSYFAQRAEALVPFYLNTSWSNLVYDEIASYSGLTPALEGMVSAIGQQEWQDWNASLTTFQNFFGTGEAYCCSGTTNYLVTPAAPNPTKTSSAILLEGNQTKTFTVSPPWESWPAALSTTYYMNLEPGGIIVDANLENNTANSFANWTVTDLTTGAPAFAVPQMTYPQFVADAPIGSTGTDNMAGTFPEETTLYHISPFDLLKVSCVSGCTNLWSSIETFNAWTFHNVTGVTVPLNPLIPKTMAGTPSLFVASHIGGVLGNTNQTEPVPYLSGASAFPNGVCIGGANQFAGAGACTTQTVPQEGVATTLSAGPGQVVGGNTTMSTFAPTFQHLVNNTMLLVKAYYDVLRAATDNGTYAIPATCTVPFPSDAFPSATNPAVYSLSLPNIEAVYFSYLESISQSFGGSFSNTLEFCGDTNLVASFIGAKEWKVAMNITASIYLGSSAGAVYPNGTADPTSLATNPLTWPIQNVQPTLLYPYEFDWNVAIGSVQPVPFNDPIAGVLINYTRNAGYGVSGITPAWGVPTYLTLDGHGNYVYVSGGVSTTTSGLTNASAAEVYISSCVLDGVPEVSTCPLQTTYFDNFTIGLVHALISTVPPPSNGIPPGAFSLGGAACGTGGFSSWYDSWAGYIVSGVSSVFIYIGNGASHIPVIGGGIQAFFYALGCILGWVVLIIVIALIVWMVVKLAVAIVARRASRR